VRGIEANRDQLRRLVDESIGIVTGLTPLIGYGQATAVAQEALLTGRRVHDIALERGLLTQAQLEQVLDPGTLTGPRVLPVAPVELPSSP